MLDNEGDYADCDGTICEAFVKGLEKFNKYFNYMDKTIIYWVISTLDPRRKAQWIMHKHENGEEKMRAVKEYIQEVYGDSPALHLSDGEEHNNEEDDSLGIDREMREVSLLYL